jgi:hypothetical protein
MKNTTQKNEKNEQQGAYLWNIIFLCIKKILVRSQYIYIPGINGNMTFFVCLVKIQ